LGEHTPFVNRVVPILAFVIMAIFGFGCRSGQSPDFAFIDRYLSTWDKFAQGANELLPTLKADAPEFRSQLAAALRQGDQRAPSRFVFYAVVQVGGFIPADSELGQAFRERVGDAVPVFASEKDGSRSYFAGDLYFWWDAHKTDYPSFPLYDEWQRRDFTRNVAVKMYESAAKNSQKTNAPNPPMQQTPR
jgi:hypothetical protein